MHLKENAMSRTNRILAGIELADRRIEVHYKHDLFIQALNLAAFDRPSATRRTRLVGLQDFWN